MVNKVKQALRIMNGDFNNEINDLIDACKLDLKIAGIEKINEQDPLISQAIIMYCKANFGWANEEADRFLSSYEMIKTRMAISSEYKVI